MTKARRNPVMVPEPKVVGYCKTAVFEKGVFEGKVGYLLWEIPSYVIPEYFGECYFPERVVPTKLYKTPMTDFMKLMLK
jgi:hypothetical protein